MISNRRIAACVAAAISAAAMLAAPLAPAQAATTIGQTAPPDGCSDGAAQVQPFVGAPPSWVIPSDGVITSFSAASDTAGLQTKLLILRLVSGNTYNVVAKSDAGTFTAVGVQTFPTRLSVQSGQLIGNYGRVCSIFTLALPDTLGLEAGPEPATGADLTFLLFLPAQRTDLSATLEPDADRDGFGDETQDQCPTNAATQGPCPQAAAATPKGEDRKCKHLRKKLKRQKAKLEKADTDKKRSMIQANIEDTKKRLEKLGC